VQFTSVEQQIKQNQNLQALLDAQQSVSLASAANYIGKTVEAGGKNVILNGGQGTMSYRLDLPAKDVSIAIKNSSGEVVRTLTGPTQTGLQTVTWDGKAESGVRLPDGTYSYVINARDSNNQAINVRTGYSGVIDAFEVIDGAIVLRSGAARVPIADVKAVRS
jgi:flagellar basal-body rod modification protein FlgD